MAQNVQDAKDTGADRESADSYFCNVRDIEMKRAVHRLKTIAQPYDPDKGRLSCWLAVEASEQLSQKMSQVPLTIQPCGCVSRECIAAWE